MLHIRDGILQPENPALSPPLSALITNRLVTTCTLQEQVEASSSRNSRSDHGNVGPSSWRTYVLWYPMPPTPSPAPSGEPLRPKLMFICASFLNSSARFLDLHIDCIDAQGTFRGLIIASKEEKDSWGSTASFLRCLMSCLEFPGYRGQKGRSSKGRPFNSHRYAPI